MLIIVNYTLLAIIFYYYINASNVPLKKEKGNNY